MVDSGPFEIKVRDRYLALLKFNVYCVYLFTDNYERSMSSIDNLLMIPLVDNKYAKRCVRKNLIYV